MKPPLREVDWEVLPPEEKRKRQGLEPLFKWLAYIMDEVLRVPGTQFRFGLDPLIGLIPGIIKTHRLGTSTARKSDWLFVISVLFVLVAVVVIGIAVSFLVLGAIVRLLFGGR
jgi:uncharacterized protein DUF4112